MDGRAAMSAHDWEKDKRPFSDCLRAWHAQPHIGGRDSAAAELRVPRSTYDGWCAGRSTAEGTIRRLMTLIDKA